MGDEDELGVFRHVPDVLGKARDVDVIQRGLDLVENTERGGRHLQDGEQQRDGRKAFFAAGQKVDVLDVLARGLDFDVDGTLEDVGLVLQDQGRLAAAEELGEGGAEGLVDAGELLRELFGHVAGEFLDEVEELFLGALHIAHLFGEEFVALGDFLVLLDGADVDGAEGLDLLPDLGQGAAGAGRVLRGLCHFGRLSAGQLILVEELVDRVVVVAQHVGLALFETGQFAGDLLPLRGLVPLEQAQLAALGFLLLPLRGECVDLLFGRIALLAQADHFFFERGDLLLKAFVLFLNARDLFVEGLVPLGDGGRDFLIAGDEFPVRLHVLREGHDLDVDGHDAGGGLLEGLADLLQASGGIVGLLLDGGDLGVQLRLFFGGGFRFLFQLGDALVRGGLLVFQLLQRGADGGELALGQFERALGADLLFVGVDEVGLDCLQLGRGVGGLGLCLVELLLRGGELLEKLLRLFAEALDGAGPGHEARVLHPGAAGHGTAGVDDLTVEGDDLEPVFIFASDGHGRVHVFDDDGAGELGPDDLFILSVRLHEVGGNVDVAEAVLEAVLLQGLSADGGNGQERGPAAVRVLQELDGPLGVVLVVDDQELDRGAEGRFNGGAVLVRHVQELGQRAVDAPQGAPAGLLHDGLDRAGIALHVLLEVFEHADASGLLLGLPADGLKGLAAGGQALVPLLLPEFVAGDGVLQGGDLLVALFEVGLRGLHLFA